MKFDQEWTVAISHLDAASQARLTEAIRHYQNTDTVPDDLDPASMMGFLFAKAVIDRRKRINARARERRRQKALSAGSTTPTTPIGPISPISPIGPISPTESTPAPARALPEAGPVTADYYKALPGYRRSHSLSYPGQEVCNDWEMITAWRKLMLRDTAFLKYLADYHHVSVDFITGHIPTYDTYLLNNDRVAVDCLSDYRLEFERYMMSSMLMMGRRRRRYQRKEY